MVRLLLKRGLRQDLSNADVLEGELLIALDTSELFVGANNGVKPVVPAIDAFDVLPDLDMDDILLIYRPDTQTCYQVSLLNLVLDGGYISSEQG